MGFGSSDPCASPLAANATSPCTAVEEEQPLLHQCLPSFSLKCPENNDAASTEPFVHSADKPLKCKVCGAVTTGEDRDGVMGKYKTTVTFGNNAVGKSLDEKLITGYAIHIVDVDGKVVEDTGAKVQAYPSSQVGTCCTTNLYVGYVAGTWPANGKMFAVVPYYNKSVTGAPDVMQMLPVATGMSGEFTDKGFKMKVVTQSFELFMSKADCDGMQANPNRDYILTKGVAEAAVAGGATGVTADMYTILESACSSSARRLESVRRQLSSDTSLGFKTSASIPDSIAYDADTIKPDALKTSVQAAASEKGLTINITGANSTGFEVGDTIGGGDGTASEEPTGAARPAAGSLLSTMIVLISALAGPRFLA